jgi:Transposase IS200 like
VEISKLVNNLKTVSSRLIRKEFADVVNRVYSKPVFWTGVYFVASCGGVTVEQVRKYVENQSEIERVIVGSSPTQLAPKNCGKLERSGVGLVTAALSPSPPTAIERSGGSTPRFRWLPQCRR